MEMPPCLAHGHRLQHCCPGRLLNTAQSPFRMKMIDTMGLSWLMIFLPEIIIRWQWSHELIGVIVAEQCCICNYNLLTVKNCQTRSSLKGLPACSLYIAATQSLGFPESWVLCVVLYWHLRKRMALTKRTHLWTNVKGMHLITFLTHFCALPKQLLQLLLQERRAGWLGISLTHQDAPLSLLLQVNCW